ncbi:MAG: hypothetical protein KA149_07835, partial [Chitinophagales bacterium]|nr:hypothetical protein [Chitinophagales bacterium]
YIRANKEERLEIFNNVQDAYDIRSKYLHGGEPNNKMKKKEFQVNLSIYIDNLLRRVLTKVILEDSAIFLPAPNHATPDEKGEKSKAFDKFLKELIF